jgi:oxygen-independent coproporphyrinogen-3 oxidase
VREGRETLADDDRYADEYLLAHRTLSAAGFDHYEVSNFGLPGRRSRHNQVYWEGAPYAALGPGAHAFYPPERRWNVRGWETYREQVDAGRLPLEDRETVDAEIGALEAAWLGLRTSRGVRLDAAGPTVCGLAEGWAAGGLARLDGEWLRLTAEGWLLLDRLAVDLASAADADDAAPASAAPLTPP